LFEYMAAGAVVVCPRLATVTDYVRDDVEVHCFEQDSDASLIDTLKEVRDSSLAQRDIMSVAAKKCAAEFTWKRRAEKINHFVLNVVSSVEAS